MGGTRWKCAHVLNIGDVDADYMLRSTCTQYVDGWRSSESIFGGMAHAPPFTFLNVEIKAS